VEVCLHPLSSWRDVQLIKRWDNFTLFLSVIQITLPVTVAAESKAYTVFARSDTGIVGSNPIQGMDVWCVYAFIL
jgi:hypothetical protein